MEEDEDNEDLENDDEEGNFHECLYGNCCSECLGLSNYDFM